MAKYATNTGTGLTYDEDDPDDLKILQRQRAVAKDQGKAGADRAASTRGRTDLESAYDEGARESAAPSPQGTGGGGGGSGTPAAPAPPAKTAKTGKGGKGRKGGGKSFPTPTLTPPRSLKKGDWTGFGLGLVLHALIVSYIRYGAAGPKGWLSAKFLNDPIGEDDLKRGNTGGGGSSQHEDPNSVPWEDLTPEERENII